MHGKAPSTAARPLLATLARRRYVFPLVHRQHHRQHLPSRGYIDGINVTPVEEILGIFAGNIAAIYIVGMSLGLHVCTVMAYLVLYGLFNVSNHTPYDLQVPLLCYSVRAHEMHHRKYPRRSFLFAVGAP